MAFGFETTGSEIVSAFSDQVKGKTFLITGPTPGGIGAETATCLATAHPKHLLLAGRSRSKIQPLMDQIQREHPQVRMTFIALDLASQRSVRDAARQIQQVLNGETIDGLILNAAIMASPYTLTPDGIESQFGTNHLGHFLLGNLLLIARLVTASVVVVGSSASERSVGYLMPHLADLTWDHGKAYDPVAAYSLSKACNTLYVKRLATVLRKRDIAAFSLNPGSIKTNLQTYMVGDMRDRAIAAARADNPELRLPDPKTVQQGCATQLRAALDPSLASVSGAYLDDCQIKTVRVHTEAEAFMDEVWTISEQLVGEKFDL